MLEGVPSLYTLTRVQHGATIGKASPCCQPCGLMLHGRPLHRLSFYIYFSYMILLATLA